MDHRPKYLRAKPIKLLEGNLANFHGFRLDIDMTPREKINWISQKLKTLLLRMTP